ncbi:MAG: DUF1911 domain-containing protein, partial [Neisseria sicca]|nr:DUF1911 domain-containing protein [Neisseria sicca]
MNENEKIPFHEKRRQNFLSEEKYQKEKNGYLSNLKFWDNNWQKSILESKHLFRYKFSEVFDYLRICYTVGESISLLSPMLDKIVSTLEVSTKFWQQNKAELNEIGYYTSPMPWFYVEYYLNTLHLIALCYLLQREDLLPRLLDVILANAEDGLEPDSTIEDFFYYRFKDRPDPDYVQMNDHVVLISDAIREKDKAEKLAILNAYLKDWYHEMVGMSDLEYQSHLDPEQNGYCGYWAFEVAA